MLHMNETESVMNGSLRKNKNGFISSYFFVIFLFVITFSAAALQSETDSLKTMVNLEQESVFFVQEAKIISGIKCSLADMDTAVNENGILTVEAEGVSDMITVYYDPQTRRIIDYSCSRKTDGLYVP